MAVRDLLWRCPICSGGVLSRARGGDRCNGCGTVFRRGRGDTIMARHPDGRTESRSAAAWLDGLADDGEAGAAVPAVLRRMRPDMRTVHYDGELIGWVERFGERLPGTVALSATELTFRSADGTETRWSLDELTSIQPSSRTLVLGLGRGGAVALEFPTSSIMRWEQRLQKAVRGHWAATGRGEVVDYQPRIVAR